MTEVALDYAEHVEWLVRTAREQAPHYDRLAGLLLSPGDTRIADIGCGAAGMAAAVKRRLPHADVIAVDNEPAVLEAARRHTATAPGRVEVRQGDIDAGHEALSTALGGPVDLAWAAHVVHHSADQQAALGDLARIVAPGGRLALAEGGFGPRFLPWDIGFGRPGLQARMEVAGSRRMEAENAERGAVTMPYGWNVALRRAGFDRVYTHNQVVDLPPPLTGADLDSALEALRARLTWFHDFLDEDDRDVWRRVLDPADPRWLGGREDLYHLEVRTIHVAHKG